MWNKKLRSSTMAYKIKKRVGEKKGSSATRRKEEIPCRACNPDNPNYHSYPNKWKEVNEAEFDFPGIFCDECGEFYHSGPERIKGKFKVRIVNDGNEFNRLFKRNEEWTDLYLIRNQQRLGLKIPPKPFGVDQVIEKIGQAGWLVDVVDVYTQESAMMSLQTYKNFEAVDPEKRPRLYNILSLDMKDLITPPSLYKELSLPEKFLRNEKGRALLKDKEIHHVERFCLLSMGGSFTDFHVDFGGSSVWYHVHTGKKVFFVVPPTKKNLEIFEEYKINEDKTIFLGDIFLKMGQCWRIEINEGESALIAAMPLDHFYLFHFPYEKKKSEQFAFLDEVHFRSLQNSFELGEEKEILWPHDDPSVGKYVARLIYSGGLLEMIKMKAKLENGRKGIKSLQLNFVPPLALEFDVDIEEREEAEKTEKHLWEETMDAKTDKTVVHRLNCTLALYSQLVEWRKRDLQEKKAPVIKNAKKIIEDLEKALLRATDLMKLPKPKNLIDREKMEKMIEEKKKRDEEEKKKDELLAVVSNKEAVTKRMNDNSVNGTMPKKAKPNL
ncbi:hypothetical protein PRIPAC_95883 [Pristionchus pacificus]|uniref:JmjC domain-containing protein n=1 Tax=Pristionchus pacificus TaxID=54126 RepID=A0A2A6BJY1_PRIPA|nr:hypothetical protein PRIPAC_95883 [Pristionchus pacificus]|eukprot:PDM66148.1 hypothetical protein PRIPAC_45373 [Pristionchus pacificus]